jgi:hypothetical protein
MTTVREARITAAARAIDKQAPESLRRAAIIPMATAVVDALFPADAFIDNAEVPAHA